MSVTAVAKSSTTPYAAPINPLKQTERNATKEDPRAMNTPAKPNAPQKPVVDTVTFSSQAVQLSKTRG